MLTTIEPIGRELSGDFLFSTKEDNRTTGIPNHCSKCENIAKVTQTFKNNGLAAWPLKLYGLHFKRSFSGE